MEARHVTRRAAQRDQEQHAPIEMREQGRGQHGRGEPADGIAGLEQAGENPALQAALVKDLTQRGLLENTLVVWGGEFGRTPMVQGGDDGRDHHPNAFTMWMAGGGIKRGVTIGESDDLGFNVVKDKVHVHDLHATMLHLLGFDHTKLTYKFQGRPFRLTDVHGEVAKQLLA